jgi:hypothetical protein
MAITARHEHFGRFGNADWKIWLGTAAVGAALMAGGLYLLRDGDGGSPSTTTPDTATTAPGINIHAAAAVAPATSATAGPAASLDAAGIVYLVASDGQLERMRHAMYEADVIRAAEGLPAQGGSFVIVDDASMASFLAGLDEANAIKVAEGLAPYRVVDLR